MDGALEPPSDAGALTRAMQRGKPPLSELEARLGHVFADPELANRALTHDSAQIAPRDSSYQRLEFLGDHVLGLAVSEMLYEAYPAASEGDLALRYNQLVRGETCAEVAEAWDVGPHVIMGIGEARGGGRKKAAILGDVCEALIAAVFLDAGYDAARALVRRHWDARMRAAPVPIRDAKTQLQEWAAARKLSTPVYSIVETIGPHHQLRFVVQVELAGYELERGEATSKRAAEQEAAKAFLERWANL